MYIKILNERKDLKYAGLDYVYGEKNNDAREINVL